MRGTFPLYEENLIGKRPSHFAYMISPLHASLDSIKSLQYKQHQTSILQCKYVHWNSS